MVFSPSQNSSNATATRDPSSNTLRGHTFDDIRDTTLVFEREYRTEETPDGVIAASPHHTVWMSQGHERPSQAYLNERDGGRLTLEQFHAGTEGTCLDPISIIPLQELANALEAAHQWSGSDVLATPILGLGPLLLRCPSFAMRIMYNAQSAHPVNMGGSHAVGDDDVLSRMLGGMSL